MSDQSASSIEDLLASLSPPVRDRLLREVKYAAEEDRRRCELSDLLDKGSEAEILAWAASVRGSRAPVVLVSTYGSFCVQYAHEAVREIVPHEFRGHRRRPVLMRGAIEAVVARYARSGWGGGGSPNGYANVLLSRYLRRVKFTCFEFRDAEQFICKIARRIEQRYHLSYHFWNHIRYPMHERDGHQVYLGGKLVWLNDHQYSYLKTLHEIARKTEKLDARLKLLRRARHDGSLEPMRIAA